MQQLYCSQKRWYIEGVPELDLTPGTWRIDDTGPEMMLHYAPAPGETFPADVTVPVVTQLITVNTKGSASVTLQNLELEHSANGPCSHSTLSQGHSWSVRGSATSQAQACDSDEALGAPAALSFSSCPKCCAVNLTFRDVGGYALEASHSPEFRANRLAVLGAGAGGIKVLGCVNGTVSNSWIKTFGLRYVPLPFSFALETLNPFVTSQPAGVGVVLSTSANAVVEYCDISGGLYNGLGGGGPNDTAIGSAYRFNHIHGNGHERYMFTSY